MFSINTLNENERSRPKTTVRFQRQTQSRILQTEDHNFFLIFLTKVVNYHP